MNRLLVITIYAFLSTSSADVDNSDVPVIKTSTGAFYGKRLDINPYLLPDFHSSVAAYTRIPYAEPPVGDLRFRQPVPKVVKGGFDATRASIACPQAKYPNYDIELDQSEDCLYLDVYVPETKPNKAAVMIWIHGGGFIFGTASIRKQLPTPLVAMNDVIVVAINYRLNVFGFLGTGDDDMPFNLGMLDQVLAMKWVQYNIAAFGGDPSRVTLFGMSAGGVSVSYHVLSPLSAGLFSGAIVQSGTALVDFSWRTSEKSIDTAFRFGKVMNCSASNANITVKELVTCLRKKSVEEIIKYLEENPMYIYDFLLGPTIDGHFVPRNPVDLSAEGEVNNVAVMIGCLKDEGMVYLVNPEPEADMSVKPTMSKPSIEPLLTMLSEDMDQQAVEILSSLYIAEEELSKPEPDYATVAADYNSDRLFLCGTFTMSADLVQAGRPVYTYLMTHAPSSSVWGKELKWTGAAHGEDMPYVFGSPFLMDTPDPDGESMMIGLFNNEEIEMAKQIMKYWSNFAKTGDPNLSSRAGETDSKYPAWPRFSKEAQSYKDLSLTFENRNGHPQPKRCAFVENVLPRLKAKAVEVTRLESLMEKKVKSNSEKSCEHPASGTKGNDTQ